MTVRSDEEGPTAGTARSTRAAPALPSRADLFEVLVRCSPDAIVVVAPDGRIAFANDRCCDLLGYRPEELSGQPVELLVPKGCPEHPAQRVAYQRSPATRAMGVRPALRARHRSGELVPVNIALSPLPIRDEDETPWTQAVLRDATKHAADQQSLLVQSVAMDAAANGIVITDVSGVIRWVNPAAARMTGYAADDLVGRHTRLLRSGVHGEAFYRDLWTAVTAGRTWSGEMANRRRDGTVYYEEMQIAPVLDADGAITHFIAIKQDISDRKRAEQDLQAANAELKQRIAEVEALHERLREQATRDPLTGLFNRRYLQETLPREVARARRSGQPLSVVALDLDHFKQVNDTLGHAEGDALLVTLATLLQTGVRASDMACRLGGDEMLVVLPGATLEIAQRRCAEWRALLPTRWRERAGDAAAVTCTLSAGLAALREEPESVDALLQRADEALYQAKREGRDRLVVRA